MKISDFAVKHPAVIAISLIAAAVFGLLSTMNMKKDLIAAVEMPSVFIVTIYPGAGSGVVEREVTDVLEEHLAQIPGLETIESYSRDSVSTVILDFEWDADVDLKKNDIRDRLNNAMAELPDNIQGRPQLFDYSVDSLPIYTCFIESDWDRQTLSDYLEESVKPRFSRISDVSKVYIRGGSQRELVIELLPAELIGRGISALEVYEILRYSNRDFPGGDVVYEQQSLKLTSRGEFQDIRQIENLVIGRSGDSYVYLKDVARISLEERATDSYFTSESEGVIVCDVMKRSGGNTMAVIEEIRKVSADIEEETGGMVRFVTVMDNSRDISISLNAVTRSAWLGGILAILILLLFLHDWRTTLIIVLSIPFSLLLTLTAMRIKGLSINIMTLTGMTVSIGMIVDSSIVILENTYKHFTQGMKRKEAASLGAGEVGSAVIASTTTSICVFITLVMIQGFAGELLGEIAWVIVFSLGASLLTALVVVPFLSALILKRETKAPEFLRKLFRGFDTVFDRLAEGYGRLLRWSLGNIWFVIALSLLIFVISIFSVKFLGFEFMTAPDMNEMELRLQTPSGYTIEQTHEKILEISELVRSEIPEIEAEIYYTGFADSSALVSAPESTKGNARIRLVRVTERKRSVQELVLLVQQLISSSIPDVESTVRIGGLAKMLNYVTGGDGFKIEVYGNDWDSVLEAARAVEQLMLQDPNVSATELNITFDRREMTALLDLDALGSLGITPYEAGLNNRIYFNGLEAGTFRLQGDSYPIVLKSTYAGGEVTEDSMNNIHLISQNGDSVMLSAVSRINVEPVVDVIPHKNRMISLVVTALMKEPDMRGIQNRLLPKLEQMAFPAEVKWQVAGSAEVMKDVFLDMLLAMAVSVFLVYMVMVIQFERFLQPFLIMGAVPFTLIGVVVSLLIFGSRLTIVSFFGIIALAGMVVNNAIVLVDYTNLLRKRDGLSLEDAVIASASSRLKPILMTTLTTILGIIPLALGLGEGAEMSAPLGQVIGGGLLTSTLITLILIPVLYLRLESRIETRKFRKEENT